MKRQEYDLRIESNKGHFGQVEKYQGFLADKDKDPAPV